MARFRTIALRVISFFAVADVTPGCLCGHFIYFLPTSPRTSRHSGPYCSSVLCCLNVPCTLYMHTEGGIWASTKEWEVRAIHARCRSERGVREKYSDWQLIL